MPQGAFVIPTWLDLLSKLWPMLLMLAALLWATIELRVRKLMKEEKEETSKAIEKSARDVETRWRSELQKPIGEMGIDAMELERRVATNERKIGELETKIAPIWKMIERRIGDFMRPSETEEDSR